MAIKPDDKSAHRETSAFPTEVDVTLARAERWIAEMQELIERAKKLLDDSTRYFPERS
ncbi:MAG TPA: hypothetical protein VFV74_07080 [Burkholderiales bacterium]|nr:hypothetical protein [Burkholderiales bacterium]